MTETVSLVRADRIARLTLARPDAMNALNRGMMDALVAHTAALAADDDLRCVIIAGSGKHFMAGGDLHEFGEMLARPPREREVYFTRLVERLHAAIENLHRMPHPVIACVHGAVAGFGLSLMCACDVVVAADSTYFTSAYRNIGLTPDGGCTYALPRLVGTRKAMEIVLLGERFDAAEALRLGLVNRVVSDAQLTQVVDALAARIAAGPPLAMRNGKRLVQRSLASSLSEQLQAEAISFGRCAATADFVEGLRAFIDKRPPQFRAE